MGADRGLNDPHLGVEGRLWGRQPASEQYLLLFFGIQAIKHIRLGLKECLAYENLNAVCGRGTKGLFDLAPALHMTKRDGGLNQNGFTEGREKIKRFRCADEHGPACRIALAKKRT